MDNVMVSWRLPKAHKGPSGGPFAEYAPFPSTRFFDNVSFIGNALVGCFLIETSDGLIMLDNMRPQDAADIEKGIIELGYDPKDLKHILMTHGHVDHFGNAAYFREKYGTKLHMSSVDESFAQHPTPPADPRGKMPPAMPFSVDSYIEGGDTFISGDTRIWAYHTPGHTPGCLSYIFEVYDEGRKHLCSLWGGTGLRRTYEENLTLYNSCVAFAEIGLKRGVDCAISTHPFVDLTLDRLNIIRNIVDGVPNPFVLGYEGYHRFEEMYVNMYKKWLDEHSQEAH